MEASFLASEFEVHFGISILDFDFSCGNSRKVVERGMGRVYNPGVARCDRVPWATSETFGCPQLVAFLRNIHRSYLTGWL